MASLYFTVYNKVFLKKIYIILKWPNNVWKVKKKFHYLYFR